MIKNNGKKFYQRSKALSVFVAALYSVMAFSPVFSRAL